MCVIIFVQLQRIDIGITAVCRRNIDFVDIIYECYGYSDIFICLYYFVIETLTHL